MWLNWLELLLHSTVWTFRPIRTQYSSRTFDLPERKGQIRLVLLGKTESVKSATRKTRNLSSAETCLNPPSAQTQKECHSETTLRFGKEISVINTHGPYDTEVKSRFKLNYWNAEHLLVSCLAFWKTVIFSRQQHFRDLLRIIGKRVTENGELHFSNNVFDETEKHITNIQKKILDETMKQFKQKYNLVTEWQKIFWSLAKESCKKCCISLIWREF